MSKELSLQVKSFKISVLHLANGITLAVVKNFFRLPRNNTVEINTNLKLNTHQIVARMFTFDLIFCLESIRPQ